MKHFLGRKQTSSNADWLYALDHIEELISRSEVEALASQAIDDIRAAAAGKRVAYAWSGGKDSLVLSKLCEAAGVGTGYFAYSDLDYPAFVQWCLKNKPAGVVPMHTGYNLDWLVKHTSMARSSLTMLWSVHPNRTGAPGAM